MKTVTLKINGLEVSAREGASVLDAARAAGFDIPTLCSHEELEPAGVCRFCMVEITRGTKSRLVASCVYPVENGLEVQTESDRVKKIRRMLIELLLPVAPSGPIGALAKRYGVEKSRFELDNPGQAPANCSLCGLCVRYCEQIGGGDAVGFLGRGVSRKVALMPDKGDECVFCRKCYSICNSGRFVEMAEVFPDQP
ncbi:MAG: 2Fe-2S iron-sulfur cluster-binding protein [Deltaproteobacteria bacterium]|jgi:NADH dehydrogenase/NADH:ubiquinone oxidoreductase subunit G|nr:2Fe-2S iron-sulfur cluster-binding protein [Deltaproteobacteria bacterium]